MQNDNRQTLLATNRAAQNPSKKLTTHPNLQ